MKLVIYLKNRENAILSSTFDLDLEEFSRLNRDFEKYRREGIPKSGAYICRGSDIFIKKGKKVIVRFDKILAIE